MSCVVEWNGKAYDVDPEEFSMRELDLIKERAGLAYPELIIGAVRGEGRAVRALFWLVDQRDDAKIKFGDYDGPPGRIWKQLVPHFSVLATDLGKATDAANEAVTRAGLVGSPSSTASDPTSSID